MMQLHILIVDDDERLARLLARFFGENGFIATLASDAAQASLFMRYVRFDLAILDVMMPGETGIELAQRWRAEGVSMPLVMLTAMGDVDHRIAGLKSGVDDYLAKPFDPHELLLRVKAILRRVAPTSPETPMMVGCWRVDWDRLHLIKDENKVVALTRVEGVLLKFLAAHAGTTVSREDLAVATGQAGNLRTIDVQVTRLRRKLEMDPGTPRYLKTVRNRGYVLWLSP